MYVSNERFKPPKDEAVKIWRYMDFTKLVSLVDSRRLFFSRADLLGDPFEGSWPKMNVNSRQGLLDGISLEQQSAIERRMTSEKMNKACLKYVAINCWHMNEHESAGMWKLYLKSDEGIAVQSTYESLRDSIIDQERVFIGTVKYIDYEKDVIGTGNILFPFVHKRKSFEHEREIRAAVLKFPPGQEVDFDEETISQGLKIKVDLERLIKKVYVAPSTPDWFADLVRALIHRYGYTFEVVHSNLDEKPLF